MDYIAIFLQSLEARGRAPRTISCYRQRLDVLSDLSLAEASIPQVEAAICTLRERGLSMASVAGTVQAVKTFYRWMQKRGYRVDNPADGLERPRLYSGSVMSKAMRQCDLLALIDLAGLRGRTLEKTCICFMADTGCRVGELLSMTLESIDLVECEAVICGKTGERRLAYSDETGDLLSAWLRERPETHPSALWTTDRGALGYYALYFRIRGLADELHIQRANPHSIRHRLGQGWLDAGANLEVVRQKLGHKEISTTAMIYGNQDWQRIKQASKRYSLLKK